MAHSQHNSIFSYNVTRQYPYRWITPLIIIGCVVFTVLFSFINFVSTGYTLVVAESSNPNVTVEEDVWFRHWPSFLAHKVQPTCQTLDLPIGSQFFTNQTALTYSMTAVWDPSRGGSSDAISPSMTYYNNVVQNCTVNSVEIDLEAMDRQANQMAYSEWGAVVRTYATCAMIGANGTTLFNITQEYDYVPPTVTFSDLYRFLGTGFLDRNITTKSSLYWGESVMSMYWASLTKNMQDIRVNQTNKNLTAIRKGTLYFYPNDEGVTNITSLGFWEIDFRFIVDKGQGNYDLLQPTTYGLHEDYEKIYNLIAEETYPNIWLLADTLAKGAYATLLTDFGIPDPNNFLINPSLLTYYTANFTELVRNIANAYPGPAVRPYGTEGSGPLGTTPSVISMKYICQVPQRKPTGALFLGILVADLVFLQALWFVFKNGVAFFFLRGRPDADYCVGCATSAAMGRYREMPPEIHRDVKLEEHELGGLRDHSRGRSLGGGHSRSSSQQRLMQPQSLDLGNRRY